MDKLEMNIVYEEEPSHPCFHIDVSVPYEEDYQIRMLKNNEIPGILIVSGCGRNGGTRYTFFTEGWMPLRKKFKNVDMDREDILSLTRQLIELMDQIQGFMLNPNRLLLEPDFIFEKEGRYRFCYFPAAEKPFSVSFHEMTEFFVKTLDYRDTDGIFLAYCLHKETLRENYNLKKILEDYLTEEKKRKEDEREEQKEKNDEQEITEKRKHIQYFKDDENAGIAEGAVFTLDEDDDEEAGKEDKLYRMPPEAIPMREEYARYGPLKKVMNRIRTGRWGQWDDLIMESEEWE